MNRLWAPWRMEFLQTFRKPAGCIFCTLPAENSDEKNLILHRGKHSFIILNRYPYNSGHLMVVPFAHTTDFTALPSDALLELQTEIGRSIAALKKAKNPDGFNVGMNLGEAGGAGVREHMHYHIVPRWNGDTNFMPLFGETRVLPETLEATFREIQPLLAG